MTAACFVLPAAVGFGVFFFWPALRQLYFSFTKYNLAGKPKWIGFENYRDLWHDDVFWTSLKVTVQYVLINIGVQTIVALAIAYLMFRVTQSVVIRGIIVLPFLVANVVVAIVWMWMLDYQLGILNHLLGYVGVAPIAWLGDDKWAIPSIALINVWRFMGYTALLLFAGMQTIPKSLYESSALDGAGEWRTFWGITMPMLRPVFALVMILSIIGSFQIFDTVAVTTKGGPVNSTRVLQYYVYEQAFVRSHYGYAAAIAVVVFVILAGLAVAQLRFLRAGESDLSGG